MHRAASGADAGLYGPASEAWRLNREAMLLLGAGPRALLLQLAHPAVAAGVADHSDFRTDPWRRLAGTLRSYLTIVYGTTAAARAEIRRLNALHRGITGPGYSARDPDLSLWVHATLVESTIAVYDAWLEPLSTARRAAYYAETRPIGRAFGVPEASLPADLAAFERYVAEMLGPAGPVHASPVARELAGSCSGRRSPLHPAAAPAAAAAVLRRIPAGAYAWTLWPSVGLLPPSVREDYGLSWGPWSGRSRPGSSPAGGAGVRCCPRVPADGEGTGGGRRVAGQAPTRPVGDRRSVDPREARPEQRPPEIERRPGVERVEQRRAS